MPALKHLWCPICDKLIGEDSIECILCHEKFCSKECLKKHLEEMQED